MSTEPCASSTARRDDILRRDQLDLVLLAVELGRDRVGDRADRPRAGRSVKKPSGWTSVRSRRRRGHQSVSWRSEGGKLVDAALVAAAGEIGAEEGGDAGLGHVDADQPRAQARGRWRRYARGRARPTAARRPARSGRRGSRLTAIEMPMPEPQTAMPRSASPRGDRLGELGAEIGIIDAFGAVGAEVGDLMALLAQPGGELVLQGETGMVGGEGDAHGRVLARGAGKRHRAHARNPRMFPKFALTRACAYARARVKRIAGSVPGKGWWHGRSQANANLHCQSECLLWVESGRT